MKLLPFLFSCVYSGVKLFVFVMNSRRHYSIFVCFIYGMEEKNSKSEVISFDVCRLPLTSCLTALIILYCCLKVLQKRRRENSRNFLMPSRISTSLWTRRFLSKSKLRALVPLNSLILYCKYLGRLKISDGFTLGHFLCPKLKSSEIFLHLRTFAPIVSSHPYCARKFTPRHA